MSVVGETKRDFLPSSFSFFYVQFHFFIESAGDGTTLDVYMSNWSKHFTILSKSIIFPLLPSIYDSEANNYWYLISRWMMIDWPLNEKRGHIISSFCPYGDSCIFSYILFCFIWGWKTTLKQCQWMYMNHSLCGEYVRERLRNYHQDCSGTERNFSAIAVRQYLDVI